MGSLESLISEIIRYRSRDQKKTLGYGYTATQSNQAKKFLKSTAEQKSAGYSKIQFGAKGSPRIFVSSFGVTIGTGFKVIVVSPFYFSKEVSSREILRELRNVRKAHAAAKLPICISVPFSDPKLSKVLENTPGWKFSFLGIAGSVAKSVRSLSRLKLRETEVVVRRAQLAKDIEEIYRLELRAYKNEALSVLSQFGFPTKKAWLTEYTKLKGTSHVALHRGKIVGYIAFEKLGSPKSTYMVSSISVLPDFQGQGISKLLYKAGLENLHSRGVTHYFGFSSTPKVLKMAKDLKRWEREIGFYVPGRKVRARS